MSIASIITILKNDLQLSLYKMRKIHYLPPAQKHKRLERSKLLLGELKADTAERETVFFSDKIKSSQLKATVNNQNDSA